MILFLGLRARVFNCLSCEQNRSQEVLSRRILIERLWVSYACFYTGATLSRNFFKHNNENPSLLVILSSLVTGWRGICSKQKFARISTSFLHVSYGRLYECVSTETYFLKIELLNVISELLVRILSLAIQPNVVLVLLMSLLSFAKKCWIFFPNVLMIVFCRKEARAVLHLLHSLYKNMLLSRQIMS